MFLIDIGFLIEKFNWVLSLNEFKIFNLKLFEELVFSVLIGFKKCCKVVMKIIKWIICFVRMRYIVLNDYCFGLNFVVVRKE